MGNSLSSRRTVPVVLVGRMTPSDMRIYTQRVVISHDVTRYATGAAGLNSRVRGNPTGGALCRQAAVPMAAAAQQATKHASRPMPPYGLVTGVVRIKARLAA